MRTTMSASATRHHDLSSLCPACIDVAILNSKPPQSPCPELLLSNAVPADFQVLEIRKLIESVEEDICNLDAQILRLQRLITQLISRRAELNNFAYEHRGTISAVRRIPSEILTEIFLRCTDPEVEPRFPGDFRASYDLLQPIIQVCGRWRTVGLASPRLWNRFEIDGDRNEDPGLGREISLRLQRSGQVPLFISLNSYGQSCFPGIMDILFDVSSRWEAAALILSEADFRFLLESTCTFPILKKLLIASWEFIEWPAADVRQFFERFPALEELSLRSDEFNNMTILPWSRIRTWELNEFPADQLLQTLPLLSPGARVAAGYGSAPNSYFGNVTSPISALILDDCEAIFMDLVLGSLTAPFLERLVISPSCLSSSTLGSIIVSFLSRSKCPLTHLSLGVLLDDDELFSILESPYARDVVHLSICCYTEKTSNRPRCIDALATHDILPNLRVLELEGNTELEETAVLAIIASRRPTLRQLRIEGYPLLSPAAVQALGEDGLEVMLHR
ncbi:hypothetical protein B0H14DRAFT_3872688 [Mycena olivaceomarginata]|nr:hypothetical protein B0H14DRAFT_3872688 [Mycena olivaceomarginata]